MYDDDLGEIAKSLTLTERLESGENFSVDRFATPEEFKAIALLSDKKHKEYGIQLNRVRDGSEKAVFSNGSDNSMRIVPPDGFSNAEKVFFHSHPKDDESRNEKSVLAMSPSFYAKLYDQYMKGDFGKNFMQESVGGLVNVINSQGVTFLVGQEEHSREAILTAKMRKKHGVENETSAPIIFIKSGEHDGLLIDDFSEEPAKSDHLGDDSHLAFTVRLPNLDRDFNMLFVTYEKLSEMGITPGEMCYGNGVTTVVEKLGVNIAHSKNVYAALRDIVKPATI